MVHRTNDSDSKPFACAEDLRDDAWPAMFESTTEEDIVWLHDVATLLVQRARARAEASTPRDPNSAN